MTENKLETLLTIAEVAAALKLAEQTVRRWVLRREIPFLKIGKAVRFRPSDIARWIDGGMGDSAGRDAGLDDDLFAGANGTEAAEIIEDAGGLNGGNNDGVLA